MSHTQHTPEPWEVVVNCNDRTTFAIDNLSNHRSPYIADDVNEANAARIVACVNACKGVSNEWLHENGVQERIDEIQFLKRKITYLEEQLTKLTNNH